MILKSCSLESLDKISSLISDSSIEVNDGFFFNNFISYSIINKGGFGLVLKVNNLNHFSYAIKIIPFLIKKNNPKDILSLHIHKRLKEVRCLANLEFKNIIHFSHSWIETGNILEKILKKSDNLNQFIENPKNSIMSSLFSSGSILNLDIDSEYQIINIFIQMELMQMSLKNYFTLTTIKERNIKLIKKEILDGVNYLHTKGIIHRDLKPENILINLDDNNQIRQLKIADFGLIIDKNEESFNTLDGTPTYMPPNDIRITEKYDVYSLGIIFFELNNCFDTDMERYIVIKKLVNNTLNNKIYNITDLMLSMVNINAESRPSLQNIMNLLN